MQQKKTLFSKKTAYSLLSTLLLLAILILLNLTCSALPKRLTRFDVSGSDLYRISDPTKNLLSSLETKVKIYYIAEGGVTDRTLSAFLDRYTALSPLLQVEIVDPLARPAFIEAYTKDPLSNHSFIFESEYRFFVSDGNNLYRFYNEELGFMDYPSYLEYASSGYLSYLESFGYPTETYFCGEDIVTGGIDHVMRETADDPENGSELEEIPPVLMEEPRLTVPENALFFYAALFIFLIPFTVLSGGILYRIKRRKAKTS